MAFPKGTGVKCSICHQPQANATCAQCGQPVCPSHSNYINGKTYCIRCKIVCPKCRSEMVTLQKKGFNAAAALGGYLVGGILLGGLMGASDMDTPELVCMACGHRWRPRLR